MHITTPTILSDPMSEQTGLQIYLKLENIQPEGSFKIRGIGPICQQFQNEGAKRFVSSSGGNAGLAVAYAGKKLNIPTTVVLPESTPHSTIEKIKKKASEVIVQGETWNESDPIARKIAEKEGNFYIPPFDHPVIWEGHATMIEEMAKQISQPECIIVSVGGGGLLCGILEGLHKGKSDK